MRTFLSSLNYKSTYLIRFICLFTVELICLFCGPDESLGDYRVDKRWDAMAQLRIFLADVLLIVSRIFSSITFLEANIATLHV